MPIRSIDYDGSSNLAAGCEDKHVGIFDVTTGQNKQLLANHGAEVSKVRFLEENKLLSSSFDGTIKMWDLTVGKPVRTLKIGTPVYSFDYDSDILAVAAEEKVEVWRLN